jgi:hypothetical protein
MESEQDGSPAAPFELSEQMADCNKINIDIA